MTSSPRLAERKSYRFALKVGNGSESDIATDEIGKALISSEDRQ